jgi:hypothetical protein
MNHEGAPTLLDIATTHALGEDAEGVIFRHHRQKAKRDKETDGGLRSDKRKKERKMKA